MYRPTLNLVPNGLSNFPDTSLLESGSSGQAFSRYVVYAASKNHLQQAPTYNPENESFSIHSLLGLEQSTPQSSLVVDNDLHQPEQLSNQDGIGTFSKPELPTVSDELRYTKLNARTVTHPPLQGASCGETSVNFSQPPSCSVAIFSPLNTGIQQQVTNATAKIERFESIVIREDLTISLKGAYRMVYQRAYQTAYVRAYRDTFNSTGDENTAKQAGQAAGRAAGQAAKKHAEVSSAFGSGESLTITPIEANHRARNRAYNKAYNRAYRDKFDETGDKNKAKQAGQTAGKAASKAARNRAKGSSAFGSGELPPPSRFSVVKRKEYLQSRSNPSHPVFWSSKTGH